MSKLLKALAIIVIVAIAAGALSLWYNTYLLGQMYANSGPMIVILGGAAPFVVVGVFIWLIRVIVRFTPDDFEL